MALFSLLFALRLQQQEEEEEEKLRIRLLLVENRLYAMSAGGRTGGRASTENKTTGAEQKRRRGV